MPRPIWFLLSLASCAATPLPFDLDPPGTTPEVFAPGVVSPDEAALVVTSRRPGGYGVADLWISTRDEQGKWSPPRKPGA
jgi:hypothetical protein